MDREMIMRDAKTVIEGLKALSDVIAKDENMWGEPTVEAIYYAIELLKDQPEIVRSSEMVLR